MAAAMAVGCGNVSERTELRQSDLKADLGVLAGARVYFGHQSVGGNILDGLRALALESGVALRVVEVPDGLRDALPGVVHGKVGKNRQPETKCDAFGRFLKGDTARWDAALLKFCYSDLGESGEGDPVRLLEIYDRTVAAVRDTRPDVLLIHATLPLLSDGLGKRDRARKLLGFGTSNDPDNVTRNRFNEMLRAKYAREPIFDVAWAESTRPDGTRSGFRKDGKLVYTMAPEFTFDEGHLTDTGQRWVAREFARALAEALRNRSRGSD
jgi:hypothetical protein